MISILVYGRNDERGYGMHKRVAISLNAMAAVIDEGTAEIIFVDYNTPDHLPTLPELLRDTLTDAARRRTRVLRVRSSIHRRFAELTPLPVLEPIARNIALRRSRPQNGWILSTNTDSLIVPPAGGSLVAALMDLPKGHFVLPRFELPERVWESFDRLDPKGTIDAAARWGKIARLDEAVRGEGVVHYDAPGDFQLVARADLFAIDGFDEEMLLGWHIDYNLAHRLTLSLGPATSLASKLVLYHCGHARQATATHSHDRRENDIARFVHRVTRPDIPHQCDLWGCPEARIEEIDLSRSPGAALQVAVEAAMSPLTGTSLASAYNKLAYDNFWYDAGHVTSYLLDLLSSYPKDAVFAFAGCRRDLLAALLKGLSALGFTNRVLAPDELAERLNAKAVPQIQTARLADVIEAADVLLFEFGLMRDESGQHRDGTVGIEPTETEREMLERVESAFRSTIGLERSALAFGDTGRLLVTINAVNNRYDGMIAGALKHTPAPFTTRLRYGFALLPSGGDMQQSLDAAAAKSRNSTVGGMEDLAAARTCLRHLAAGGSVVEENRLEIAASGSSIAVLLESGRLDSRLGASKPVLVERLAVVTAPAPELSGLAQDDSPVPQAVAGSGLGTLASWNDAAWLAQARRVSTSGPRGSVLRNGWIWERAQILTAISPLVTSRKSLRALVVAEHPDILVAVLANDLGTVEVGDVRSLLGEEAPRLRTIADYAAGCFVGSGSVKIVDLGRPLDGNYDLIVLPHSALFRATVPGAAPLLAKLRPHLADGGTLVIAGEVAVLGAGRAGRPALAVYGEDGLAHALAAAANLTLQGDARFRISKRDAALVGTAEDLDNGRPVLGLRRGEEVFWPAVWLFTARGAPAPDLGARLKSQMASLVIGNITSALGLTERARREGQGIVGLTGRGAGHIFFGPYIRLPSGSFKASIEIATTGDPGKLTGEVCIGAEIVAQQEIKPSGSRRGSRHGLELPFEVSQRDAEAGAPCEIRLWSEGKSEVVVSSVSIATN